MKRVPCTQAQRSRKEGESSPHPFLVKVNSPTKMNVGEHKAGTTSVLKGGN